MENGTFFDERNRVFFFFVNKKEINISKTVGMFFLHKFSH